MRHPIESSPHYPRYLFSESLAHRAMRLSELWDHEAQSGVPKEVRQFIYRYFWSERGTDRGFFELPGLHSFPFQVHPNTLHQMELATYGAEANEIYRLVERWCRIKQIPSWRIADLDRINERQFAEMRAGDFDSIARYLKAVFEWWDELAGPRFLREASELSKLIQDEVEVTRSYSWKIRAVLIRIKSGLSREPLPVRVIPS